MYALSHPPSLFTHLGVDLALKMPLTLSVLYLSLLEEFLLVFQLLRQHVAPLLIMPLCAC